MTNSSPAWLEPENANATARNPARADSGQRRRFDQIWSVARDAVWQYLTARQRAAQAAEARRLAREIDANEPWLGPHIETAEKSQLDDAMQDARRKLWQSLGTETIAQKSEDHLYQPQNAAPQQRRIG